MSRILRRPMFRGGRVDGRGTGITSGLSYQKGGRVGYDNGGLTLDQRMNIMDFKKGGGSKYTEDLIRKRFNKYMDNLYTGDISDVDIAYGMQLVPDPSTKESVIAETFQAEPETAYEEFKSGLYDDTNYADLQKKEMEIAKLAGLDMKQYGVPEKKKVENDNNNNNLDGGETETPELTDAEKLAKYTELFEKAYGSGRGDDISNMLLSFAGKALKPEATVKSSFGEFFEDEAKRPSERKKYKDAATTAAINAFLTGEKSFKDFENALTLNAAKLKQVEEAKTSKQTIDNLLTAYAGNKNDRTDEGVMQASYNELYKKIDPSIFEGKLPEDESQLIVGKIYYEDDPTDSRNKITYIIEEVEGVPTKRRLQKILK